MFLGLISFLLFIAEVFHLLDWLAKLDQLGLDSNSSKTFQLLEVVHVCLFITMICYIILGIFLFGLTKSNKTSWRQAERRNFGKLNVGTLLTKRRFTSTMGRR